MFGLTSDINLSLSFNKQKKKQKTKMKFLIILSIVACASATPIWNIFGFGEVEKPVENVVDEIIIPAVDISAVDEGTGTLEDETIHEVAVLLALLQEDVQNESDPDAHEHGDDNIVNEMADPADVEDIANMVDAALANIGITTEELLAELIKMSDEEN